jgi:hypothetical protein
MGSGFGDGEETVEHLVAQGEKVGVIKVRLYRPFDAARLVARCPSRSRRSPCSTAPRSPAPGEPLYLDVVARCRGWQSAPGWRCPRHRRPLRPVVEGVHAGDGQGGLRRARKDEPKRTSRRHQRRRDPD